MLEYLKKILILCTGYTVATYFIDVNLRRAIAAKKARAYATKKGLPLLNIGAGTNKTALFGATLYGDVNCDLSGRKDIPHGTPGEVTWADAQNLKDFKDGQFGAILASHLLEHLPNPEQALSEWLRVVGNDQDALFIITPQWWAPHTWLHPGHLWYATDGCGGTCGGKLLRIRDSYDSTIKELTTLRGVD